MTLSVRKGFVRSHQPALAFSRNIANIPWGGSAVNQSSSACRLRDGARRQDLEENFARSRGRENRVFPWMTLHDLELLMAFPKTGQGFWARLPGQNAGGDRRAVSVISSFPTFIAESSAMHPRDGLRYAHHRPPPREAENWR
jgi:hypothetical protein